jgi:CRP/FNR family cyclic AMP-dependent transcriptional regulator
MEDLQGIIRTHRFFAGLGEPFIELICGCAKNAVFEAGEYLFHEGEEADHLYLIRHGRVALQLSAPGLGTMTFQTLNPDEIVGASWVVPPYRWTHDARALELTRAIAMDARCLRGKCEQDHDLGYELMKRFVPVLSERLHRTRMQMLDVYGSGR